jgi:hypothetical protein
MLAEEFLCFTVGHLKTIEDIPKRLFLMGMKGLSNQLDVKCE